MSRSRVKARRVSLLLGSVVLLVGMGNEPKAETPEPLESPDTETVRGEDITEQARDMNSDRYAGPPNQFRTVAVSLRKLGKKRIRKHKTGFEVRLPSGAPVTTPAVYQNAVYVSGGFRSRQFYALDAKSGQLKWGVDLGDDGPSAPACEEGVCVFNTESCTLFSLDARTGKKLWAWWLGDPQLSAPTISRGRVFTAYPARGRVAQGPNQGIPNQLQQEQGHNHNHMPEQQAVPQHQAMPQHQAVPSRVGSSAPAKPRPPGVSHVLAAFNLKTGKLLWQRWIDADVMSAPVASEDELLVTTFAGTIYRFRQRDGHIIRAERTRATSAPVVVGDDVIYTQRSEQSGQQEQEAVAQQNRRSARKRVYGGKRARYLSKEVQKTSSYHGKGVANDAANGFGNGAPAAAKAGEAADLIGQGTVANLQAYQGSRQVGVRGQVVGTMGDEVVATNPKDGTKLWSLKVSGDLERDGGALATSPAAAGDFLFVGTLSGEVLQLAAKSGKVIKRHQVGRAVRSQPVLHDGWLYVGTDDGRLVAIDTGDRSLTGWAQWGVMRVVPE
ncbi:PQQ-binding-like beta-propeller repeat protein [Myxococcota bacterium]